MFSKPKYIQNSFNIVFSRQPTIRREANEFEDRLKGRYFQPQIISVPDELDPEIPRMIFGSEHGFSQIIVSQVSIALNVNYSPDWQIDISKGKEYLNERTSTLFNLLDLLDGASPFFCGLTTKVHISSDKDDKAILKQISRIFLKNEDVRNLHDLSFKRTEVVANRFFSNMTVNNFRTWKIGNLQQGIRSLSPKEASERGMELIGDFNDRYSFNEDKKYRTTMNIAQKIIDGGLHEIEKVIDNVGGKCV